MSTAPVASPRPPKSPTSNQSPGDLAPPAAFVVALAVAVAVAVDVVARVALTPKTLCPITAACSTALVCSARSELANTGYSPVSHVGVEKLSAGFVAKLYRSKALVGIGSRAAGLDVMLAKTDWGSSSSRLRPRLV